MKVLITGYPAAGKTTLAKKLAGHFGMTYVDFVTFATTHGCVEDYDEERQCHIINEDCISAALDKINKDLIIDSHIAHLLPGTILILVTADRKIIKERMQARGYPEDKIQENIDAMNFSTIEDEIEQQGQQVYIVDATKSYNPPFDAIVRHIEALK